MDRRNFLALPGTAVGAGWARRVGWHGAQDGAKADITLHISTVEWEVAPRKVIKTSGYNRSVYRTSSAHRCCLLLTQRVEVRSQRDGKGGRANFC